MNDCVIWKGNKAHAGGAPPAVKESFDRMCREIIECSDRPFMIIGGSATCWMGEIDGPWDEQVAEFCDWATRQYGIVCTTGASIWQTLPRIKSTAFHITKDEKCQKAMIELNVSVCT